MSSNKPFPYPSKCESKISQLLFIRPLHLHPRFILKDKSHSPPKSSTSSGLQTFGAKNKTQRRPSSSERTVEPSPPSLTPVCNFVTHAPARGPICSARLAEGSRAWSQALSTVPPFPLPGHAPSSTVTPPSSRPTAHKEVPAGPLYFPARIPAPPKAG